MSKTKYNFTKADIKYRKSLEAEHNVKFTDAQFFSYIEKQKKWLRNDFVPAIKEWIAKDPVGAEQFGKMVDRLMEKDKNRQLYDEVAKIKKLSIADIEKLLVPILERAGYKNLQFLKPDFGRGIKVEFTAQESKAGRHEYNSRMELQKLIKQSLLSTNWKLMSEGISYHLGFLQGRLIGIEDEDDLKELVKLRKNL